MAFNMFFATLALTAALYCSAVAFPFFPPTLPRPEPTEATTAPPTTGTPAPASGLPADLATFLKLQDKQNNEPTEASNSSSKSTANLARPNQPETLRKFFNTHSPDASLPLAFHIQLNNNATLGKYNQTDLKNFVHQKPGQFAVGMPFINSTNGTFMAPIKAIYHFTTQVHFFKNHSHPINEDSYITVAICIDGDCINNAALQSTTGVISDRFSVLVTGELQVEKDQVVSVVVKNSSNRKVVIDEASSFMGYIVSDSA